MPRPPDQPACACAGRADALAAAAAGVPCIGYANRPDRAEGLTDADALVVDDMQTLATAIR